MTRFLLSPGRRFAFVVAVSVLIHAILLWLPDVTLPRFEAPLPLLSAKLVALPKLPPKPVQPKPIAKHSAQTAPVQDQPQPESPILPQSGVAASSVPPEPVQTASAIPAEPVLAAQSAPVATVDYAQTSDHAPPLPKHARLRFVAQLGAHGIYIGEIRHELNINDDGHYTLHAELETTGLARLIKRYQNIQDSRGSVSHGGLRPDNFTEAKTDEHGTQRSDAAFDWGTHQIGFATGGNTSLPDGAQDILSFLYQLSQLPFNREVIPLAISNGRKIEYYKLEVGTEELIDTPMGKLRALHLSKMRNPGEEGMEIWLAMEYRLLPVKLRQIERDGKIAGEIVIKEIRVSDE